MNNKKHRGIFHSIQGLLVVIITTLVYVGVLIKLIEKIIIIPISEALQHDFIPTNSFLEIMLGIVIALFVGYTYHLIEDSQTVNGIHWLYKKDFMHLSGQIKVGSKAETIFVSILTLTGVFQVLWLIFEFSAIFVLLLGLIQFYLLSFILNRFFSVF